MKKPKARISREDAARIDELGARRDKIERLLGEHLFLELMAASHTVRANVIDRIANMFNGIADDDEFGTPRHRGRTAERFFALFGEAEK